MERIAAVRMPAFALALGLLVPGDAAACDAPRLLPLPHGEASPSWPAGSDCDPVPLADLAVDVGGLDGTIVAQVRHVGGDAASIAPRLRFALRIGAWPFALKPLPGGCIVGSVTAIGPTVDCVLANVAPGTTVERVLRFTHKAPSGAVLGVDAQVVPTTRDPVPADNAASVEIALWQRELQR